MRYLLFAAAGYLSGSILYSYFLPKLCCGVDVRALSADANPGAANAFRYGGVWVGLASVLLDILKGLVPVLLAARELDLASPLFALVLAGPVVGHAFPFFTHFQGGGKAIAVSFGVLLGLYPLLDPVAILIFYYLLFSLGLVIDPHFYRSVVTFFLFAVTVAVRVRIFSLTLGCALISFTVVRRHFAHDCGEKISFHLGPHHAGIREEQP